MCLVAPQEVQAPSGFNWWPTFRSDLARYRQHRPEASAFVLMMTEQGLWALLQHRIASAIHRSRLPPSPKRALMLLACVVQKLLEMVTGISIPYQASIGPGLYIGHFGNIILHPDTVLGHTCNLSQGVTIGASGRGPRRGVPRLGDRVYVCANAVVVGRIRVGDEAVIAANSLVTRDVPPRTIVMGVPARPVKQCGSEAYLDELPLLSAEVTHTIRMDPSNS